MALQVSQVLPGQVDAVWLQVDRLVARGLRQTGDDSTTSALIREDVRYGRLAMWVVHDDHEIVAVVVLNIVKRLTGPVLIVVLIAGRDFQSWAPQDRKSKRLNSST